VPRDDPARWPNLKEIGDSLKKATNGNSGKHRAGATNGDDGGAGAASGSGGAS
jgi:hypothetical protein